MISFDERSGVTTLECDGLGCRNSHSVVSSTLDGGRSAVSGLFVEMMKRGWYTETKVSENKIRHFCPKCGENQQGVQQLTARKVPAGGNVGIDGIVSAQELRQIKTPKEASSVRNARKRDIENGVFGLSDMDEKGLESLKSTLAKGKKVFGDD